jgi:hypothetical protein
MRKLHLALIASCLMIGFGLVIWLWNDRLGELNFGNRGLAARCGTLSFTSAQWSAGDEEERGKMVADLVRRHRFLGSRNQAVYELLGSSTCYHGYEDEPCYRIRLDGKAFQLGFGVNHSDRPGEIVSVSIYKY